LGGVGGRRPDGLVESSENARQIGLADQHLARLRALVAGDHAAALHHVDQPSGAGVSDTEAPLEHRGRGAAELDHRGDRVWEETANAMRAGTFALIIPVMMSALGRWVASSRWIPTARDFWASRMIASSTSPGAIIMRSASSSITHKMYGSGWSPSRSRTRFSSTRLRARALLITT